MVLGGWGLLFGGVLVCLFLRTIASLAVSLGFVGLSELLVGFLVTCSLRGLFDYGPDVVCDWLCWFCGFFY